MAEFTPNICIDFDGVIHSYDKGWCEGVIYGNVVPGFFEWAHRMLCNSFKLTVYSSRSAEDIGTSAMKTWLTNEARDWDMNNLDHPASASNIVPRLTFANVKPIAWLTIDDRAICFNGDWSAPELSPENIGAFRAWMNQPKNDQIGRRIDESAATFRALDEMSARFDARERQYLEACVELDQLRQRLHAADADHNLMQARLDARDTQVMGLIDSTIRLLDLVHVPRIQPWTPGLAGAGYRVPANIPMLDELYAENQAPVAATTTGCQICGEPTHLGCCNPLMAKPKAPPVMPNTHEARAELQRKLAAAGLVPLVVVGKEGAAQAAQAIKAANEQIAALQAGVVDRFEPQPDTPMFTHVNHCPRCGAAYAVTEDHTCAETDRFPGSTDAT